MYTRIQYALHCKEKTIGTGKFAKYSFNITHVIFQCCLSIDFYRPFLQHPRNNQSLLCWSICY